MYVCVLEREKQVFVCVTQRGGRERESAVPVLKWCTAFFVLNFSFKFVVAKINNFWFHNNMF